MSNVVDRRGSNKNRLAGSRAKFINRHKQHIQDKISDHIRDKSLSDIEDDIPINIGKTKEVRAKYSNSSGTNSSVHPGNKQYNKGDKWKMPKQGGRRGSKGGNGDLSEDDFEFVLSKDEFMDMLFKDMALPNFLKKSTKLMTKSKLVSGGYVKEGIPARLAIKKTLQNAVARRIASGKPKEQTRFLDDIDLRYRNLVPEERPISHAVIFMVMDVSGSMDETRKMLAKKFFLLLYLFLKKQYQSLEVRFISHTTDANEVDEDTFFYSRHSGGTAMSPAFELVNNIIDKDYNIEDTNIYIAQASDGENWDDDFPYHEKQINILLPKIQYFAYVEVDNSYTEVGVGEFYKERFGHVEKLTSTVVNEDSDVFKGLYKLFGVKK